MAGRRNVVYVIAIDSSRRISSVMESIKILLFCVDYFRLDERHVSVMLHQTASSPRSPVLMRMASSQPVM